MLQKKDPIVISEFNKGLYTKGNILIEKKGHSPDCMDIKWNFDTSIQKRYGSYKRGQVPVGNIGVGTGWVLDSQSSLSVELAAYWRLNEVSGSRKDECLTYALSDTMSTVSYAPGIRSLGANFICGGSTLLVRTGAEAVFNAASSSISFAMSIKTSTSGVYQYLLNKGEDVWGSTNLVPIMTSDTEPSGTVTSSGDYSATYVKWKAFDGNDTTYWESDAGVPGWIKYDFGAGRILSGYSIFGIDVPTNSPTAWTLAGSNNDSDWTTLDSQSGQNTRSVQTYHFKNIVSYRYYRLTVSAINGGTYIMLGRLSLFGSFLSQPREYCAFLDTANILNFNVYSPDTATLVTLTAASHGALSVGTWYNCVFWIASTSHIGLSVDLSADTAALSDAIYVTTADLTIGGLSAGVPYGSVNEVAFQGTMDEIGFWRKALTADERVDLYGGGSGNTFAGIDTASYGYGFGLFDFGASGIRWLIAGAGTGVYASSDMGLSYVSVATDRTAYYQNFERSKNVLICTSDSYDPTLFWAGSVGTCAQTLALNSAPAAKFSLNFQGFLILLNCKDSNGTISKRRFQYADDTTQLTSPWQSYFDVPSSADDEITGAFVVNRILYVSTRYRIFRVSYVGGNPDWSYQVMQEWGYVPRTIRRCVIEGIPHEVVIGLDWQKRLRMFDGINSLILSDNVESDNGVCEFATSKISYFGSGIAVSNAEFDPLEQEYRLNVAIGAESLQTTHALVFNARTLALYPYSKQFYQSMCIAESNNRQFLLAIDRTANVYILNTGNTDDGVAINEHYDSPFIYNKVPGMVNKGGRNELYFKPTNAGSVYYEDRVDFENTWKNPKIIALTAGLYTHQVYSTDLPYTYNVYQYRLTSSSSTTEPWCLTHSITYEQAMGVGKGQ